MRVTRCDGLDCAVETDTSRYGDDYSWIVVEADEDADHGHFCSWSCLAAVATSRAIEREALT